MSSTPLSTDELGRMADNAASKMDPIITSPVAAVGGAATSVGSAVVSAATATTPSDPPEEESMLDFYRRMQAKLAVMIAEDAAKEAAAKEAAAATRAVTDEAKFNADAYGAGDGVVSANAGITTNVLHEFVNFTYLLTLHMMAREDLEELNRGYKPSKNPTVIMASAGISVDPAVRHAGWSDNFYLEDLSMESVIGFNAQARGSNAIKIAFKIIEPNGVSLMERLLETTKTLKCANFKEVSYVLQIDFTGYDSDGVPTPIKSHTKYIPMVISGIGFKVSERGSEYNVSAVPFNHQALTQLKLTAPTNMSITASTVAGYFTDASVKDTWAKPRDTSERSEAAPTSDTTQATTSTSFMSAINRYERKKVSSSGHQDVADIYNVIFDEEIGNSLLVTDVENEAMTSTPLLDNEVEEAPATKPLVLANTGPVNLNTWFEFGSGTGSKEMFLKLHPVLQQRMVDFAKQWYSTQFTRIKITSAYRTAADQKRLNEEKARAGAKYLIAPPGKSLHESGLAVDISSYQANKADSMGLLAQNGLMRPHKESDPVHIVMIENTKPKAPVLSTASSVPTTPANLKPSKKGQIKYGQVTTEINSGTILIDEINKIVRNSAFLHNQLTDPSDTTATTVKKPLRWWKIVPVIEQLDYDHKRQTYGKKITYYVKAYNVYSSVLPGTPSIDPPISRVYSYLFSGQNLDIKDFNLEFNTQFYLAMSVNINNWKATSMAAEASTAPEPAATDKKSTDEAQAPTGIPGPPVVPVANSAAATAGAENKRDKKSRLAGDVQEMLMNQRGGDMIALSMTILGDPAFIKQDDILSGPNSDPKVLNGSLPTDSSEVYIKIEFKTPVDVSMDTGLLSQSGEGNMRTSKFSGLYRVTKVESTFARGEFLQKVEAVRIFTDLANNTPPQQVAALMQR